MYRVVIVDDEPFMLEGMRLMIEWEKHGFSVCAEASSAQEALHLIDSLKPHLLITDVRMPGMQGTDLAVIVHRYHPETILLFFSGYRDFAFAQSAIRSHAFGYLVKPIDRDEVHQTLDEVKKILDERYRQDQEAGESLPILRDHVLRRIASGDTGEESLMRAGILLDIKRDEPCYCAVLLTENKPFTEGALQMLAGCGGTPFLLSPDQFGVCFKQIEQDLNKLSSIKNWLDSSFDLSVRVGVGRVLSGTEGFGLSLTEAMDAMGLFFSLNGGLRLYRPSGETVSAWMMHINPQQLVKALEKDTTDELSSLLHHLKEAAAKFKPEMFDLRYMAKTVDSTLLLSHTQSGQTAQTGMSLKALWSSECEDQKEWLMAFSEAMHSLKVHDQGIDPYPPPVRTVINMIRKDYGKNLCLGKIASGLHLNPAYLGQLILRLTGQTFHALLLDTRISHACRLLRQTSRTIQEIAYMVGFRDVDYFSRQFRSRMAVSPNAYRNAPSDKEDTI